ncbi:MAG TPA: N-acetylgalactosamine-6-sulfatase, partial [Verrucomicrobiales bacterium]|nr:N-acetylgalactosamine-6-sulfatase [Verrucomicrobiales bacterium]
YEGGVRVPCIVRWPGKVPAGSVNERVTGFEDWLPTLLELSGSEASLPSGIDGISFATTLLGGWQRERPFLYREFPGYGGQQFVRIGEWKGIRQGLRPRQGQPANLHIELYNLAADIGETADLSAAHPEIVRQIKSIMDREHRPSVEFPLAALDR